MTADLNLVADTPSPRAPRRTRPADPLTELIPWLDYVDRVLQHHLSRQQQRGDDRLNMQGLLVPPDELDTLPSGPRPPRWLDRAAQGPDLPPTPVARGRFASLASRFGLSVAERAVLLLSLLPLFEARYSPLIAYLQGDDLAGWPSVDLALMLFSRTPTERIALRRALTSPHAPLLRHGLIASVERSGRASERGDAIYLRGADPVFHYLCGDPTPGHKALVDCGTWLADAGVDPSAHAPEWRACAAQLRVLCFSRNRPATPVILLQGGDGRDALLARFAADASTQAFVLNLDALPDDGHDAWEALRAALQLTRLTGSLLVLRCLAEFEARHARLLDALDARLADHGQPVIALTSADEPVRGFVGIPRVTMTLPPRARDADAALVRTVLEVIAQPADSALDLTGLLTRTRIDPDRLPQTLTEAALYGQQRAGDAPLAEADLHTALRLRAQRHFGKLAQRIEPRRRLPDLIASDALLEQLLEILAAIRQREAVLKRGFGHKIAYGTGISALFYGESGTGKSMAAEILAGELGVDLIRVDLATVVNKYIGETEKNLSRIFDLAVADTGVLLFDEADALFGKRSEVKDAHDRHANIEVSYLLQRLEHYPGLVVLSTNNRGHLDEAFTRRLTFMTRFDAPDAELRLKMWRAIWPAQVAVADDIDWARLAERTDLTGAEIRNVALLASWLAAEGKRAVTQADIERAVKRELAKTGRLTPRL